jgi:hypothetical protein
MQTKPAGQRGHVPELAEMDAETEQAMLVQWQRRARAFAWACGVRLDRTAICDED